jgi:hypothetical protein
MTSIETNTLWIGNLDEQTDEKTIIEIIKAKFADIYFHV